MFPQARKTKEKLNIVLHQAKKLCTAKEAINNKKRQPTEWKEIFEYDLSGKGLIFKICKDSYNSTS